MIGTLLLFQLLVRGQSATRIRPNHRMTPFRLSESRWTLIRIVFCFLFSFRTSSLFPLKAIFLITDRWNTPEEPKKLFVAETRGSRLRRILKRVTTPCLLDNSALPATEGLCRLDGIISKWQNGGLRWRHRRMASRRLSRFGWAG